jgi:hypothetical protein
VSLDARGRVDDFNTFGQNLERSEKKTGISQIRTRYFGVLGLDPLREEENKIGGYKTLVAS